MHIDLPVLKGSFSADFETGSPHTEIQGSPPLEGGGSLNVINEYNLERFPSVEMVFKG